MENQLNKQLKSGTVVNALEYYHILDWKDNNREAYIRFLLDNYLENKESINDMSIETYNKLRLYIKRHTDASNVAG